MFSRVHKLAKIPAAIRHTAPRLAWVLAFAVLAVTGQLGAQTDAGTDTRPNILVFLSDDMGWAQPGFNGGTEVGTPNLDRIANEGVKLTQFYVQPRCSPTRASLLTGRYPWKNGMEERPGYGDSQGMLTDESTIAEILSDAGYATWLVGKWHLGQWKSEHLPLQRGFDHHYGLYSAAIDSFSHIRVKILDWHRNESPVIESGYSTFLLAEEAIDLIERHDRSSPFFLFLPFNAIHNPNDAPQEYIDMYADSEHPKQRAQLKAMDVAIGQVLDALDSEGLTDDTLVVFLNDNGGVDSAGWNPPYRGKKSSYHEGGIRVPTVLRWPDQIPAGSETDALLHVVDLFPTLAGLAEAQTGGGLPLDGVEAWQAISADAESPRSEVVHSLKVIRVGDWKLIEEDGAYYDGRSDPLQLYNISDDPYEATNLASSETAKVEELRARLEYHKPFARDAEASATIPNHPPRVYGADEQSAYGAYVKKAAREFKAGNTGPKLDRLELSGASAKLVYDETLDGDYVPPTNAFEVILKPEYATEEVNTVAVSGREVVLTLANVPGSGDTLGITYEVPDTGAIRDADGLEAVGVTWAKVGLAAPKPTGGHAYTVTEGDTDVGTLEATDEDTPFEDLVWLMSGGDDASDFSLGEDGVLTFAAAKDFESPDDTDTDGTYELTVQVSDGGRSATTDITVTLANLNEAPNANAGSDQANVAAGATVTLSGSGSDPDASDTLNYEWRQTNGTNVTLSTPTAAETTFAAPNDAAADLSLVFVLKVTDAAGLTAEDEVAITVSAPVPVVPLTVQFENVPTAHNGTSGLTVTLRFSEALSSRSRAKLRDGGLVILNGTLVSVRRVNQDRVVWQISVEPTGTEEVTVSVAANVACDAGGLCTTDGKRLSQAVSVTVAGPPPTVTITAGASVSEGVSAGFTLERTGATTTQLEVAVTVTESGSMLSGTPATSVTISAGSATASLSIATVNDAVSEAASVVTATMTSGSGYTVGSNNSATVTVTDDDEPSFTLTASPTTVEEGAASTLIVATGGVTFGTAQTIGLSAGGSAASSDYSLSPSSLTLSAGSTSAQATLTAVNDSDEEPDETVRITASHNGANVGSVTVTILANDEKLSDDATLSALSLSGVDIGPFSPSTTSYSADVENAVTGTTVTARANDADASVRIADPGGSAVGTSRAVAVAAGENRITVTVTAEDGTTKTYTVTVTRAEESVVGAQEGDVRLANGSDEHEGRVEIYHSGQWGTVCDDYWSQSDAEVLCRQLGYTGIATGYTRAHFGQGADPIWMDNVRCGGDEERLADCAFAGWGVENCRHSEDAGVSCGASSSTSLSNAFLSGPVLTLQYNGNLSSESTPSPRDFVVLATGADGADAVPVDQIEVRGSEVVLGLSRGVSSSDTLTLSYLVASMHPIEDESGNLVGPIQDAAVRDRRSIGFDVSHTVDGTRRAQGFSDLRDSGSRAEPLNASFSGAVKLERLDLSARDLSDISLLWGISDLERLGLGDNVISDLSPLTGLIDLSHLDLSNNQVTDISALAGMVHLRRLDLSNNRISDVSALAGLTNLRRLDLSNNRISDVSALAGLQRLEVLLLDGNALDEVSAVAQLKAPVNLGLSGNRIKDIGLLAGLGALRRLNLSDNRVTDITALGNLSDLEWLRLDGNLVADPSPLLTTTHLRWVWLDAGIPGVRTLLPASSTDAPRFFQVERLEPDMRAQPD